MKKSAFTLIELLISIMILSILMLFLYKSYSNLNRSNMLFSQEVEQISHKERLRKTLFLDFATAMSKSIVILKQNQQEDVVFLQTNHSVHRRINPYVAYIVKNKYLYRLESLKPFNEYPLAADSEFVVDKIALVKSFRVYKSKEVQKEVYLIDILFEKRDEVLLKVNVLNSL